MFKKLKLTNTVFDQKHYHPREMHSAATQGRKVHLFKRASAILLIRDTESFVWKAERTNQSQTLIYFQELRVEPFKATSPDIVYYWLFVMSTTSFGNLPLLSLQLTLHKSIS